MPERDELFVFLGCVAFVFGAAYFILPGGVAHEAMERAWDWLRA